MSSKISSRDHSVPAPSTPASPFPSVMSYDPYHYRPKPSSSSTSSSSSRRRLPGTRLPRVPVVPRNGMRKPLEDVTDVVLSAEYSYSPGRPLVGPLSPAVRSYEVHHDRRPMSHMAKSVPGSQYSTYERSPKQVHWADLEERSVVLSTPPATPLIGRLDTPELEPMKETSHFCDCCPNKRNYREGRAKMDSQLNAALAHIRGASCHASLLRHQRADDDEEN